MDRLSARVEIFRVDNGAAETLLGDLALEDLFLDGSGREKSINSDDAFLSVAPNAGHRLKVVGGIPVDVV